MRRGLTVLEILVGLVLLAVVAIPIATLSRVQECEGELLAERLLVTQRLNELADGLECASLIDRFTTLPVVAPRTHEIGGPGGLEIEEEAQVTQESSGLYRIRVKARWRNALGRFRTFKDMESVRFVADPEWGSRHGIEQAQPLATKGEEQ
jgi:hypothetical protein